MLDVDELDETSVEETTLLVTDEMLVLEALDVGSTTTNEELEELIAEETTTELTTEELFELEDFFPPPPELPPQPAKANSEMLRHATVNLGA